MKLAIQAIILVVALQLYWTRVTVKVWAEADGNGMAARRISVGFPLHSVHFARAKATRNWVPSLDKAAYRTWVAKFRLTELYLNIDAGIALGLFFGFRWLLRFRAAQTAFAGIALNLAFISIGALGQLIDPVLPHPTPGWLEIPWGILVLILTFGGVPLAICWWTRWERTTWYAFAVLTITSALLPWTMGWLEQFAPFLSVSDYVNRTSVRDLTTGFEVPQHWPDDRVAILIPIALCAMLIVPVLLIRRFVPFVRKWASVPVIQPSKDSAEAPTNPTIAPDSGLIAPRCPLPQAEPGTTPAAPLGAPGAASDD